MLIMSQDALDAAIAKVEADAPGDHTLAVVAAIDATGASCGLQYQRNLSEDGRWKLTGTAALHYAPSLQELSGGAKLVLSLR